MTISVFIDLANYSGLTRETHAGSAVFTNNANPAEVTTVPSGDQQCTLSDRSILADVFGATDVIEISGRINRSTNAGGSITGSIYLSDGSRFVGLGEKKQSTGTFRIKINRNSRADLRETDATESVVAPPAEWAWYRITISTNNEFKFYYNPSDSSVRPTSWAEIPEFTETIVMGEITEIGFQMKGNGTTMDYFYDSLRITSDWDWALNPIGLDASIVFSDYYIRTALNGGGNAIFTAPAPFLSAVSSDTFIAQPKRQISYLNVFGVFQFIGEVGPVRVSTHGAVLEAEEMIRKTMFTEVGASPVVFSTFLRQWNNLVITDKDGDFVNRGITTSHIASFAKTDTKVYEGRATRDAFSVVQPDFSTPRTPNRVSNNKDEEMYYKDKWDNVDTDKAHIMIDSFGTPSGAFVVKYPIDVYEKFNNLTKLNKLELVSTISALTDPDSGAWAGSSYKYYLFNYHTSVFEEIKEQGKNSLKGPRTTSIVDNIFAWYDPIVFNIDVVEELKSASSDYLNGTTYSIGDRAIISDTLYTSLTNGNQGNEPPDVTHWQRTVYDFINYESTAGSASIFSKQNTIMAIKTPDTSNTGIWVWDLSLRVTFDEDNEPEFSSASISAVTTTTITLNATGGINLPEKDGFGVGDILAFVKSANDYLQDAWDASSLLANLGVLNLNITDGGTIGVSDDHTFKSFFILMQHISELTNSTFWADYDVISTVEMASADNHSSSGVTLIKDDIVGYNSEQWEITYDGTKQRNQIRILGDNVNFLKTITPDNDPFDLGDEIEIIEDNNIQTLLQASNFADKLAPRLISSEIIATLTLNYSKPNQDYTGVEVGKTIALKLPTASDTSIANFSGANELLIIAVELNRNEQTGDQDHATLTLQRRYS